MHQQSHQWLVIDILALLLTDWDSIWANYCFQKLPIHMSANHFNIPNSKSRDRHVSVLPWIHLFIIEDFWGWGCIKRSLDGTGFGLSQGLIRWVMAQLPFFTWIKLRGVLILFFDLEPEQQWVHYALVSIQMTYHLWGIFETYCQVPNHDDGYSQRKTDPTCAFARVRLSIVHSQFRSGCWMSKLDTIGYDASILLTHL